MQVTLDTVEVVLALADGEQPLGPEALAQGIAEAATGAAFKLNWRLSTPVYTHFESTPKYLACLVQMRLLRRAAFHGGWGALA